MASFFYSFNAKKQELVIVKATGDTMEEFTIYPLKVFDIEFAYAMATPEPVAPVADKPEKRHYKKHEAKPEKEKVDKYSMEKFVPTRVGEPKPCCGSKGPRHMKMCKFNTAAKPGPKKVPSNVAGNDAWKALSAEDDWIPPVTNHQFSLIKDCLHNEMTALEASNEMDIPIDQINLVYRAKTYVDYQRLAREAKNQRYP